MAIQPKKKMLTGVKVEGSNEENRLVIMKNENGTS